MRGARGAGLFAAQECHEFATWYRLYPRKKSKIAAEKAYEKARKRVGHDRLMAATLRAIEVWHREQRAIEFIPYPATWLNEGGFLDDEQPAAKGNGSLSLDHVMGLK